MKLAAFLLTVLFVLTSTACGGDKEAARAAPSSPTVDIPFGNRIRIPAIGVDAPLNNAPVAGGQLGETQGTDDVVFNEFSPGSGFGGRPGSGNLVVHGRIDSGSIPCHDGAIPPPCTAVFWNLTALAPGDSVEVFWDRARFAYIVSAVCGVENARFSDRIVATTERASITLMTAGGQFNQQTRSYSHQVVVVGQLPGEAARVCPEGTIGGPPDQRKAVRFEGRLAPGATGNPFTDQAAYEFRLIGVGDGPLGAPGSGPIRTIPALPGNADGVVRSFQRRGESVFVPVPTSVPSRRYLLTVNVPGGSLVGLVFEHRP
jgi:hypothetical protein